MQLKQHFIVFIFLLLIQQSLFAQDPQFSQFYGVPLYTNPAFTGTSGNLRVNGAYRDQYVGIDNNFVSYFTAIDAKINKLNGGLGLSMLNDVAGDGRLNTVNINAVYAFHTALSRKINMSAAVQASYVQKSYDFSKFRFGDQIDDRYGFVYPTKEPIGSELRRYPNFGAGVLIYGEQFFGGFAAHNLTEPNQSFYYPNSAAEEFKLPRRYTAHAGLNLYLTNERLAQNRVILSPNILYMTQRNFNQLNLGMYIKKQALTAGLWFRQTSKNSDAAIVLLGMKFPKFRLGYSYDVTISNARTATQGSHELSVTFEITMPKKTRSRVKTLVCPEL